MHIPETFEYKLEREFRGRLRVRWSKKNHEYQIEQKVGRGLFPGSRPSRTGWDESNDEYVRNRDGYIHILSIRTGTNMPCPRCGHTLKVPYMVTHHLRCPMCRLRGRESFVAALFMPLGDSLIDYLRKIDPENPISERLAEDLDRENEALAAQMEQDAVNPAIAAFEDDYRRVIGIPTAHLSGRTQMWKEE